MWLGRSANGSLAAIKVLRAFSAAAAQTLFAREKRALLRLQHPNLVPVFDVGDRYIVSAYIEGADLRHRMRSPIPVQEGVNIICEIASALSMAHAAGIIHCDVKPANILISHEGRPFLADFGIATFTDDEQDTDLVRGTPAYMAPEQKRGMSTPKSDQYSLAKTLLVMLGGTSPLPPREAVLKLPEAYNALTPILLRALEQAPEKRFPSISLMATELKALALADTETMTQLAPTRRPSDAFAWVGGHHSEQRFGEHIVRTNYRLSELEAAGLLDSEAVAQFRKQTGCADFGWSMYARDELLGPLSAPAALARAKHTTVFLHGLFTNREIWKDVAIGTSRDNGLAVVLTPDLPGFGESRLGKQIPREVLSPKGMIHSVNAWLALIGIGDIPKVVMGHSYSAAALMCIPQEELGDRVHTICLTPAFVYFTRRLRLKARTDAFLARLLFALPKWLARGPARFLFRRDPTLLLVNKQSCNDMAESALQLGGVRVARLFASSANLRPAAPHDLRRCTVVTTPDDPLVPVDVTEQSILSAGIPDAQWYRLIYGGHFPQLVDEDHPEWGARNVHELVSLIDSVLDKARATKSGSEKKPTSSDQINTEATSSLGAKSLQQSASAQVEVASEDDETVHL